MIEITNTVTPSPQQFKSIIMGMRNPMNSWDKSDTNFNCSQEDFKIRQADYDLMKRLCKAGSDHRKFMRMITVYIDVNAPMYWYKEMDTYKVGTVRNSCSTMHKIHAKEFTLDDFSHEHLASGAIEHLNTTIEMLNEAREVYINYDNYPLMQLDKEITCKKDVWWQMIQLLPNSYNQKSTFILNYEVLSNIYKSRKDHKFDEWRDFCKWIETLPYSELITQNFNEDKENANE